MGNVSTFFQTKKEKNIYVHKKGRKIKTGKCSHVRFVSTVSSHNSILTSLCTLLYVCGMWQNIF